LVWIAKSASGGVCVLASSGRPAANGHVLTASSCSTADGLAEGASIELTGSLAGSPNRFLLAGVVPSGVSSVTAQLADGSTDTVDVSDNAWALETESGLKDLQVNKANVGA
jgi:hypothetical protein